MDLRFLLTQSAISLILDFKIYKNTINLNR